MSDPDTNYVTEREINDVWAFEMTRLDKDLWPRDNAVTSRALILEHFERLKHELFKVARRHRRVYLSDSDRAGGEGALEHQPGDWDTTAEAEFERNRKRYEEKLNARRGPHVGLGRGETD